MGCIAVLTIDYDLGRLSPNLRIHPAERRNRQRALKLAARAAWRAAGEPRSEAPVRVNITAYRTRCLDPDNLLAALKAGWDGCLNSNRGTTDGITPDDSPRWVEIGSIRQVTGKRFKGEERVVLEVFPREVREE